MKIINRILLSIILLLLPTRVEAQLTPDETLGTESSDVNAIDELNDRIDNGAVRGANLFHSFAEFNVDEGRGVFFNSSADIQNIVTRVTGNNVSNILGKLGVLGEANLFLINPNGIIFGENASLDVRGSLVSTTANALQFGEQGFFSATNPDAPPLLTVQPSAFFFNQVNTNPIENNSLATAGIDPVGNDTSGLRVPDGSSLLMIGGDVILNGGNLQARGGRIELGGLQSEGAIALNIQDREFSLIFPDNVTLSNISLNQGAEVNVRGADGGSIAINAENFTLSGESVFRAGIDRGLGSINSQAGDIDIDVFNATELNDASFISHIVNDGAIGNGGDINVTTGSLLLNNNSVITTSPLGQGNGGNMNIDATNSVVIQDGSNLNSSTFGTGNAGDINITTEGNISFDARSEDKNITGIFNTTEVAVQGGNGGNINLIANNIFVSGSQLSNSTFGSGNAGNINLNAQNIISVDGEQNPQVNSGAFSIVGFDTTGNGGAINVETDSLFLTNGGQLNVVTFGQGNAGEINIDARDIVSFDGIADGSPFESGVFSGVFLDATGDGGNININTDSLSLNNSAVINANTLGNANGGAINIVANSLSANNGGQIFTTSRSNGNAGNISLNIANNINLAGTSSTYFARLEEFGADLVDNAGPFSGLFANTSSDSTGDSGSIEILGSEFLSINLENEAQIAVDSAGIGVGGEISLQGDSLTLDRGVVTAEAVSNQGGNINLEIQDLLLLRNGSQINSSAGSNSGVGDGGNININADLIVAFPGENSDISANAFLGNGGRVEISTKALLGIEFRSELTSASDITASSEFGVDGIVEIDTPDDSLSLSLTELPTALAVPPPLQGCEANRNPGNSSFINTGRGGLPPSPYQTLDSNNMFVDVQLPSQWLENSDNSAISPPTEPILEVNNWIVNEKGRVELVSDRSSIISLCNDNDDLEAN